MQIRSVPQSHEWVVVAPWHGKDRVVFTGTVRQCIMFRSKHEQSPNKRSQSA